MNNLDGNGYIMSFKLTFVTIHLLAEALVIGCRGTDAEPSCKSSISESSLGLLTPTTLISLMSSWSWSS